MLIRAATSGDTPAMRELVAKAFGEEGPLIGDLVSEMMDSEDCLIWVAEDDGMKGLVGASTATLNNNTQSTCWVLAPLGVGLSAQGRGTGSELVNHFLHEARQAGVEAVFVYGDPGYYGRFGFSLDATKGVRAPFELEYPEGWLALWLGRFDAEGDLGLRVKGPLNKPDLW